MEVLYQKRWFTTICITNTEEGIIYLRKSMFNELEVEIPFEDFGGKIVRETKTDVFSLVAAGVLLLMMPIIISSTLEQAASERSWGGLYVLLVLLLLSALCYVLNTKRFLYIEAAEPVFIKLYSDRPSGAAVDKFVEDLVARKKAYLLKKYTVFEHYIPVDTHLANLFALKNKGVLSEEEFKTFESQLLGPYERKSRPIGFRLMNSDEFE